MFPRSRRAQGLTAEPWNQQNVFKGKRNISHLHSQGDQGTLRGLSHHGVFSDDSVVGDTACLKGRVSECL